MAPARYCSFTPDLPFWSQARVKLQLEHLQTVYGYLLNRLELPNPNVPSLQINSPEDIEDGDIEAAAMTLRKAWGMKDGPIPKLTGWVESRGSVVLGRFALPKSYCVVSQWTGGRGFVLLEATGSAQRQRFNLAHALGHFVLHREAPAASKGEELHGLMETQAHHFAAAFLFPKEAFLDEVQGFSAEGLRRLSRRWGLSTSSLLSRAVRLGLLNFDAFKRFNPKGFADEGPIQEAPRLLRRCFAALIERGGYTPGDILRELALPELDIVQLAGLRRDFFSEEAERGGEVIQLRPRSP